MEGTGEGERQREEGKREERGREKVGRDDRGKERGREVKKKEGEEGR